MEAQLLSIDLTNRSYQVETLPGQIIRKYLGGRGLGAYLLCRSVPAQADPLGEENHVIFAAGPANGTNAPYSSKVNVITKSPLTGIYLYAIASGTFAHQIRKAGFWAIDIKGIASSPVYLQINNQTVEFKDASGLWGIEAGQTQRSMLGNLSTKEAATVAIGPAGEKLIRYANIVTEGDLYRTFGRGGAGSVMGAKKLKGIVISGNTKIEIADRNRFEAIRREMLERITENKEWVTRWRQYGTGVDLEVMSEAGILPTRNWRGGQFEGWSGIATGTTAEEWPRENLACGPFCLTPCAHHIELKKGPYQGAHCDGPEYETIYAFGSQCGVDRFDAIVAANQICDEQGLDTMSAGISIGFAMECFEQGLIGLKDTDGIELRFGNTEAMMAMLDKIVNLDGFGKRLAEGVKRLSNDIPGSAAMAMHTKGMEFGGYECRGLNGQALQYAINNRGGDHHAYGLPARAELQDGSRQQIKGKGEQVRTLATSRIISDSIPLCTFVGKIVTEAMLPDIISSLLGEPWSADDLKQVGIRVICQERLFNMREGITREHDSLPDRLLKEPKPDGPTQGAVVPLEELKDDYYRAMGWDLATGNPSDVVLDELEIERG